MGAAADCEAVGAGFLGQPINTLTTLGFVAAGIIVIVRRQDMRWIGIGLVSTGIGSFLFHGPMPPGNEWAHDVSLAWLVTMIAGWGTRWEWASRIPALVVIGAVVAVFPLIADPLAAVMSAVAVISILIKDRSAATVGPLLLLASVAVIGRLGATGGPLCDPDSLLQPHAIWHLGSALAVTWWAIGAGTTRSVRVADWLPRRSS
ncbi:MAG TPA: hypothetical protein VFU96_09740 [Acidimicrobiia bacterium]|nr:hypothetical protein [Acidimicrobiia bacterium]